MAWQDYMIDDEALEYWAAKNAKEKSDAVFQLITKKYKPRCDARMRRDPNRSVPKSRSKTNFDKSQKSPVLSNETSKKGAE